jgi:thioesterase domain-containing protein
MAADYVADLRQVQAHGPYVMGGFCLGGPIALEMASQLRASGEEVELLVLLDPRFRRPKGLRYTLWLAQRRVRQRRLVQAVGRRLARTLRRSAPTLEETAEGAGINTALARIRESYEPRTYGLPTAVILSEGFETYELPTWYLRSIVTRPSRWRRLRTEHVGLLLPPNVDAVATEIRAALDEARGSQSLA